MSRPVATLRSATVTRGEQARQAGAGAVAALRQSLAQKAAELLQRDPERAAQAVEVGLVDRNWLDDPLNHPLNTATPLEVIQRFLERSVEQRPSALASLGLSAVQMLAWESGDDPAVGVPQLVTVVFTDLEGFTSFTAAHGDEAATQLVLDHHRVVGPVIRSRGGHVVKRLGDGLMLSFATPESAVLAAVELAGHITSPLRLRAGVHMGEAVVTRDDVLGHVVNVAARITEEAAGGEVLVSRTVCETVDPLPGIRFSEPTHRRVKGIDDEVVVCAATPG